MMIKKFKKVREQLLIHLVDWTKPYYAKWFKRHRRAWNQDVTSLKAYPKASLGYELGHFLEKEGFDLMPKLEDHDIMHILLNYKTTIVGEVKMQFFLLGNRKKSLYALVAALAGLVLVPEYSRSFFEEFRLGRKCINISKWDFEHLLSEPLRVLQGQILRQPYQVKGAIIF